MTLPPCGKFPALEALKDAKEAINAKLNLGKSALADLQTKLNTFKADVLAAIPKIPSLDSFQVELAGLIGASPTDIAAFLAKWQGKVAGLNELVARVTGGISGIASLDFCKDVPNVKLDPATGEVKTEPAESTPPSEAPVEPTAVPQTTVAKETQNSIGKVEEPPVDIKTEYETTIQKYLNENVLWPLDDQIAAIFDTKLSVQESDDYLEFIAYARQTGEPPAIIISRGNLPGAYQSKWGRAYNTWERAARDLQKWDILMPLTVELIKTFEAIASDSNHGAWRLYKQDPFNKVASNFLNDERIDQFSARDLFNSTFRSKWLDVRQLYINNVGLIRKYYRFINNLPEPPPPGSLESLGLVDENGKKAW